MAEPSTVPDFEDVIRMAIEQRLFDLQTAMPGEVVDYDKSSQSATVQPVIKRSYSGKLVNLPAIQKVPVHFPRAGAWKIHGPVKKGDTGLLVFSSRSVDVWKKQGGIVDPKDPRKFHITDAFFIPGVGPFAKAIGTQSDHLRVENGSTRFELQEAGKMRLEKVGGDELLDLLIQITTELITVTDKLSTDKTNTLMGPMPLLAAADYGTAKGKLETLKSKIQAIKG